MYLRMSSSRSSASSRAAAASAAGTHPGTVSPFASSGLALPALRPTSPMAVEPREEAEEGRGEALARSPCLCEWRRLCSCRLPAEGGRLKPAVPVSARCPPPDPSAAPPCRLCERLCKRPCELWPAMSEVIWSSSCSSTPQ